MKEALYECNIIIEFCAPMVLVRLFKVCLNKNWSKVCIGKNLSFSYRELSEARRRFIHIAFQLRSKYIHQQEAKEYQEGLKLNATHKFLVDYPEDVNLLRKYKHHEAII
jgi:hypothetical protein